MLGASSPLRLNPNVKMDKVKKNAKGGVLITPEEIQMAFQLMDVDKNGQISLQSLKKRLGVLFPELSIKDYRCFYPEMEMFVIGASHRTYENLPYISVHLCPGSS